jgi:hypothetical protein
MKKSEKITGILGESILSVCGILHKCLKVTAVIAAGFVLFFSVRAYFKNDVEDNYTTESALTSHAISSTKFDGVFIRDEEIIGYDGNGAVSYNVEDGGRLGNGSVIAEIYVSDEQIQLNQRIAELSRELELLERIQNPGTSDSAQPADIAALIEESYRNSTYRRELGDFEDFQSEKEDMLVNLSTYQIIVDSSVDFSQKITDLKSEINSLRLSEGLPSNVITADRSAYFVSYADGYEQLFKKDAIDSLTLEMLENTEDRKLEFSHIIGKLIKGYDWYIAGVIDNSKKNYEIGDKVKLKFESCPDKFNGEIIELKATSDSKKTIVVISCKEFNYDLVQHRSERVEIIDGEFKGLKVSREAIRFKDITETVKDEDGIENEVTTSYKGVYIIQGEQVVFKKLDVIYEGKNYVLSAENKDREYLSLYDEIIVDGVDSDGK